MREILVYDDYEIHKLGAGGGTQYEEVTTEKATRIDVTDVAKPKGKLIPFGRTTQNGEPTPENPIPIENVEGRSCRNRLNLANLTEIPSGDFTLIKTNDGGVVLNGSVTSIADRYIYGSGNNYVSVPELILGTNYLSIITNATASSFGLYVVKKDSLNNTTIYNASASSTNVSFEYNEGDKFRIFIRCYSNTIFENIKFQPMISNVSNAEFEPYFEGKRLEFKVANGNDSSATGYQEQTYNLNLGNIELCKIGNFQDYFYKENNKWYIHKETKKVVLDENITIGYSQQANNVFYGSTFITDMAISNNIPFCNYYKGENNVHNAGQASNKGNNKIMFKDFDHTTYIIDNRFTTVEEFIDWLENHNIIIYYGLKTPTTTEITDTTLISQLEALSSLLLYKGTNHIWTETDGLEPNLQLTYKRKKTN